MDILKNLNKKQKLRIIAVLIVFVLLIIIAIVILISRAGKIATTVQYAPYKATVIVNGKKVKNKSKQYFEPGEYDIEVSAEHFETYTEHVTISKDYTYMVGILKAADDEGEKYKMEHKIEFAEAEGLVGRALNAEGVIRKKNHPILNYLPINNALYSISYDYDIDNVTPIIVVKTQPVYLDDAVAKLKTLKNVDLTAYEIVFKTENPFALYDESATGKTPKECVKNAFNIPAEYTMTTGQDITDNYYTLQLFIDDYDLAYQYSHYRVLLHKDDNDMWKIVAAPQPLLTQKNTPNTPKDILNTANSL